MTDIKKQIQEIHRKSETLCTLLNDGCTNIRFDRFNAGTIQLGTVQKFLFELECQALELQNSLDVEVL